MFCANCGKEIKDGVNFCSSCGTKIESTSKENIIGNNINSVESNTINISIKNMESNENTTDFYMNIKGIKSRFDHGYNYMQSFAIVIPLFIAAMSMALKTDHDTREPIIFYIFFFIILPITILITLTKINPRGVFINNTEGILIKNKKAKFGFLKDELHLQEVFAVQVQSFKIDAIPFPKGVFKYRKNIFLNALLGSGDFYKFTFFDKNRSILLSIHLSDKNDRNKLIEALKNTFNILGKNDIEIEINNSVSRDFNELAM